MSQVINALISLTIVSLDVFFFGKITLQEKIKVSKLKFMLAFILLIIFSTLIFLSLTGTIKTILMYIANIVFYKYIFNISIKKSIILSVLCFCVSIISDMIVVVITSYINKAFFYKEFAGGIRASLYVFTLIIIFTFLLRKLLQKIINMDISNSYEIIFYSILTVVCILISFYETFNDSTINLEFFVNVLTMGTLFFSLGIFVYQAIKNNILTKKNDKLMEFMTTYENELEDLRIEEHETKNELVIVRGRLCDNQERQDIIDYIDDTLKDRIEIKQEEFVKLGYLPPNGIKGFCYLKVHEAQKQGITAKINISSRVKNSNIYKLNLKEQRKLGKILGVYLDNAIEAAKESEKKIIGIEAYLNKDKECQLIISNSYKKIPDAEKMGRERISTKGTKRGHGLLLVKRIVNNSDVFETKTEINNVVYIQKVIIKNRKILPKA